MDSSDTAILTYWDGRGNAELIRLMMAACGQKWIDQVYKSEEQFMTSFEQLQPIIDDGVLAFDQLPLLRIDGLNIVQKMAAVRYLARKYNKYGADNAESTKCDIIAECIQDFYSSLSRDDMKGSFEAALAKSGPKFERALNSNESGSGYFVGNGLTFVDIVFWNILNVGIEIGASLAARPELQAYYDRVAAFPPLAEYLASERRFPVPGRPGYYDRVKNTMPWLFGAGSPPPMTSSVWNYKSK